jgi:hypothetical protein
MGRIVAGTKRGQGWTDEQLAYMQWLSIPPALRQPPTKSELARQLNLDISTFFYWEKKPGWSNALSLVALKTLKDLEPQILQARIANMLTPQGWQERVAYDRYIKPHLYAAANDGLFDEVLPSAERQNTHSMLEAKRQYALERFAELPPDTQSTVQSILQGLGKLEASFNSTNGLITGQEATERVTANLTAYLNEDKLQDYIARNGGQITRREKRALKAQAKLDKEQGQGGGGTDNEANPPTRMIIQLRPELQQTIVPADAPDDSEYLGDYDEDEYDRNDEIAEHTY